MVNNELSKYRESKALQTFLEENEGLVVNHGESFEEEDMYYFICENSENEIDLINNLHTLGFKNDFGVVDAENHMKCEHCSKIISDYHTVITKSEVLCLLCHNEQMKKTGEWRFLKGSGLIAYRYSTKDTVEILSRLVVKQVKESCGFGVTFYYDLEYRVGFENLINKELYNKHIKKRGLSNMSEESFIKEYEVPRMAQFLYGLSRTQVNDFDKGIVHRVVNDKPLSEKECDELIKEITNSSTLLLRGEK